MNDCRQSGKDDGVNKHARRLERPQGHRAEVRQSAVVK
jgi:hypothetical protein